MPKKSGGRAATGVTAGDAHHAQRVKPVLVADVDELSELVRQAGGVSRKASTDELNELLRDHAGGDAQTAALLLAAGADVRSVDSNGLTALHWAVYNGPEGYARELLRAGATVDAASNVG
jgi:ankyrin repeat protein